MIEVALETGEDRRETVRKAIEALGDAFIEKAKAAQSILIKVNLVHHQNQLASTHVDAVRAVLDVIRAHSRANVVVGDTAYHGTKAAFRNFGYERLPEEYEHVELLDLNDDDFVDGYTLLSDGSKNTIRRSKTAAQADLKISLAVLKMHRDTAVSLSVKNWTVGTWVVPPRVGLSGRVWARWPWLHEQGEWAHHAAMAALFEQLPCDVALVDGMVGMEGDGPTRGTPVPMGAVIAGFDAVAVDSVSSILMGVDPTQVGYLVLCAEQGLGEVDITRINVPPALVADLRREFERPPGFEEKLLAWRRGRPEMNDV